MPDLCREQYNYMECRMVCLCITFVVCFVIGSCTYNEVDSRATELKKMQQLAPEVK